MNKAIDEEKLLAIEPRTKEKPVFRSISEIDIYDLDKLLVRLWKTIVYQKIVKKWVFV